MGPSTMPPVMAMACCRPMIAASSNGKGSLTAKKGGRRSVLSFLPYGHFGCNQAPSVDRLALAKVGLQVDVVARRWKHTHMTSSTGEVWCKAS